MYKHDMKLHGLIVEGLNVKNTTLAAIASLRIAIRSYFETYHACRHHIFIDKLNDPTEADSENNLANLMWYQEKYFQTIFHFHHFIELVVKDVLREIDPLYAVFIDTDDLVKFESIRNRETVEDTAHTIEYNAAIKRIMSLKDIKDAHPLTKIFNKPNVRTQCLDVLNGLRNRGWHRGLYVLRYTELDKFISMNILPLVLEILECSQYREVNKGFHQWKYTIPKELTIDPIQEIITAGIDKEIDYSKIAFYKAIGLACYNYNIAKSLFSFSEKRYSRMQAEVLKSNNIEGAYELCKCFVCGHESLVLFRDYDVDDDLNEQGNYTSRGWWISKAECQECSLLLYDDVGNPKEYGIEVNDIWLSSVK